MKARVFTLIFVVACQQALAEQIEVYFSPKGGCTEAVVKELDAAKATVLVQAYSFTSAPRRLRPAARATCSQAVTGRVDSGRRWAR